MAGIFKQVYWIDTDPDLQHIDTLMLLFESPLRSCLPTSSRLYEMLEQR